jgi:glutathione synthase/RimK-type ligase-like ATP-grasp enzyme
MADVSKPGSAELLYARAGQMGLAPVWLIRGQLMSVTTNEGLRYLHHAKSELNSQLSSSLTRDKLATRRILEQHGLPSIPSIKPDSQGEAERFLDTHSKIIVKPLEGSNCRDVNIVETQERLVLFNITKYLLEKYINGREFRYLLLDGQIIGVHESEYGGSVSETRSLQRISYPRAEWSPALMELSLKVARILRLRYAAVDFLIDEQGHARILEVNSSPGMKWFHAPTSGPEIDVAGLFLETFMAKQQPANALD